MTALSEPRLVQKPAILPLTVLLLTSIVAVAEQRPHVHGEASLELVQNGPRLYVRLESPGASLLGFEHQPQDEADRSALAQLKQKLVDPRKWLLTPGEAACVVNREQPASFQLKGETEGHDHSAHGHEAHAGHGHLEIVVEVGLVCAAPAELNAIEIGLFADFPGLRRIRASLLLGDEQDYVELSTSEKRIVLAP